MFFYLEKNLSKINLCEKLIARTWKMKSIHGMLYVQHLWKWDSYYAVSLLDDGIIYQWVAKKSGFLVNRNGEIWIIRVSIEGKKVVWMLSLAFFAKVLHCACAIFKHTLNGISALIHIKSEKCFPSHISMIGSRKSSTAYTTLHKHTRDTF